MRFYPTFFQLASQSKRFLRLFRQPRPEVVISNNSGVFFTLASLKMHGREAHPHLRLIMPDFWLNETHGDYNNLHWGQTPRGLPWYVRQEFLEIFPTHEESEFIRWGQFKELREHVIHALKKSGVPIYFGTPTVTRTGAEYVISVVDSSFRVPLNTFFYNTYRIPNVAHALSGIPDAPSHTKLYALSLDKVPKTIILIGGGRSAIWVAQHFPNSLVSCVRYSNADFPLFRNETRPLNLIDYPLERIKPIGDEFEIQTLTTDNHAKMRYGSPSIIILDLQKQGRDFAGHTYCSIGLRPNFEVTACIDKGNLLKYPYEELRWIGPEETPLGSLMEATQRWAAATNNLAWAYETYCYHEDYFIELFTQQMNRVGIVLPYAFFDLLRENALALENKESSLNAPNPAPSETQVIQLYKKCYSQALGDDVSDEVLTLLGNELVRFEQERLKHYQGISSTRLIPQI